MSDLLNRSNSFRKAVRPIIDRDEIDDEQRRDVHGRKRVDVVHCLLDSSSDETEESIITFENINPVLWLTFSEVCHIRSVLAQTTLSQLMLSDERQALKICSGRLCFRCHKTINDLLIFITFLRLVRHYRCFICRQTICKNCAHINFATPSSKLPIAVRIQTLIKPSTSTIDRQQKVNVGNKAPLQTVCYDCLEIFSEQIQVPERQRKPPAPMFRRTLSLPPNSIQHSDRTRHTRQRRRPLLSVGQQTGHTHINQDSSFSAR